jgi:hypothetical protein
VAVGVWSGVEMADCATHSVRDVISEPVSVKPRSPRRRRSVLGDEDDRPQVAGFEQSPSSRKPSGVASGDVAQRAVSDGAALGTSWVTVWLDCSPAVESEGVRSTGRRGKPIVVP